MNYQAVVWDLDGTLLDTLDDLTDAVNHTVALFGMPTHSREAVCRFVGNGIHKLIERAVPAGTDEAKQTEVYEEFCTYYKAHCNDKTKPYPGILPLLDTLGAAGVSSAIVSNKGDFAVKELAKIYFGGRVAAAVGGRDGIRLKPAPDAVFAALAEMGVPASRAVFIGDSDVDIRTAENAGMDCISVSWGFREAEFLARSGAQRILDTPEAVLAAILG